MTKYGFTLDLEKEIGVARAVGGDGSTRENSVRIGVLGAENLGRSVPVYEEGSATCFGGFEAVLLGHQWKGSWGEMAGGGGGYEELKACALAVIGCVGMGGKGERSVCCVGMFKITCKVPETSVV